MKKLLNIKRIENRKFSLDEALSFMEKIRKTYIKNSERKKRPIQIEMDLKIGK
jgi:hypothetical protein